MHQKPEIGGSTIKTTERVKENDSGITDIVINVFAEKERGKEFGSARF